MATITSLKEQKLLFSISVPLDEGELPQRLIYGFPDFVRWLAVEAPNLQSGRLKAAENPQEQLDNLLYRWIAGKRIIYDRMFKDLMPMADEVWEMKTVDIRVFGWMYRPLTFIAVFGNYADLYKGTHARASYEDAKKKVKSARAQLDLDEPKFTPGVFDELVCI